MFAHLICPSCCDAMRAEGKGRASLHSNQLFLSFASLDGTSSVASSYIHTYIHTYKSSIPRLIDSLGTVD
jgi:hypothetical protein